MTPHEQFADDLALYAMGSLEGDERAALEAHLETCAACRNELDALRADLALVALSAPGAAPRPAARARLLSAVAREPRGGAATIAPAKSRPWRTLVPSLAAAALAIVAFALWRHDQDLRGQLVEANETAALAQEQLDRVNGVLATLADPAAARFTLSAATSKPQPQGRAIYARERHSLIFLASNLPALPPQKAYELWLIPTSGAPIPAGIFKPDAAGGAAVINPPLPSGVEAKTFAITVEPESGSAAPTSQPIMVGTGG
jgi:anti-sigma-K factor RskA